MITGDDFAVVVFAYNRPEKTRSTLESLQIALRDHQSRALSSTPPEVHIAIDGPKSIANDKSLVDSVAKVSAEIMPDAVIDRSAINRSLPAHLTATLDALFLSPRLRFLICIEDDVELSPTVISALLHASDLMSHDGYVIGASPTHRDGSIEHQAILLDRRANTVSSSLLKEYIQRFSLDGASSEGAYGRRDHEAINAWSRELAAQAGVEAPTGTSQDRIRELSWKREGIRLLGLPMRLVRHRGYWGQHNTPWYALRTGQLFQRLDRRPWETISREIRATIGQR